MLKLLKRIKMKKPIPQIVQDYIDNLNAGWMTSMQKEISADTLERIVEACTKALTQYNASKAQQRKRG